MALLNLRRLPPRISTSQARTTGRGQRTLTLQCTFPLSIWLRDAIAVRPSTVCSRPPKQLRRAGPSCLDCASRRRSTKFTPTDGEPQLRGAVFRSGYSCHEWCMSGISLPGTLALLATGRKIHAPSFPFHSWTNEGVCDAFHVSFAFVHLKNSPDSQNSAPVWLLETPKSSAEPNAYNFPSAHC